MDDRERAEWLETAARQIETVMNSLNLTQHDCTGCGQALYDDWSHKQNHDKLGAALERVRRAAGHFFSEAAKD